MGVYKLSVYKQRSMFQKALPAAAMQHDTLNISHIWAQLRVYNVVCSLQALRAAVIEEGV